MTRRPTSISSSTRPDWQINSNDRLKTYDSALESLDPHSIGDAAGALDSEIRADARLVNVPRLYGCYDPKILTGLQNATNTFADTLDALSCAGNNMCNRKPTEVSGLVGQAKPQERTYVQAINAYAAQFGGEQLPLPQTPRGSSHTGRPPSIALCAPTVTASIRATVSPRLCQR